MHFQKPPLGTPLDWEHPFNKDLALHLAMNEGYGDVVRDLSMNGNHGTLNNFAFPPNVASGWNPGQTGVGLKFDGTDDYIDCGNAASLNPDEITGEVWIKIDSSKFHNIISKKDSYLYFPRINNDGKLLTRLYFSDATETGELTDPACTISDNNWHYIVCSFSSASGNICVYIDGQHCKTYSGYAGKTLRINTEKIYIGSRYGTTDFADGSIDEVRIHNRALTAKEVKDYAMNPWRVYLDEEGM